MVCGFVGQGVANGLMHLKRAPCPSFGARISILLSGLECMDCTLGTGQLGCYIY